MLKEIPDCISDFREIYVHKSITLLERFIDKYVKSKIKNLKSFANGFLRDFEAIKNSVISEYSNGFIEGNNNRLKMIKRTMYGSASLNLLRAEIITSFLFYPFILKYAEEPHFSPDYSASASRCSRAWQDMAFSFPP